MKRSRTLPAKETPSRRRAATPTGYRQAWEHVEQLGERVHKAWKTGKTSQAVLSETRR